MLKIQHLNRLAGGLHILKDVSFKASKGGIVAILGPSGSGKTSLLRCLAQLDTCSFGAMDFNDQPIAHILPGKLGLVFQSFHLFPNFNVLENLVFAPMEHGMSRKDAIEKADEYLQLLGLMDKKHIYPHRLSGGQKQRVAIARALMLDPWLLMFDEPTSALDPELVHEVGEIIAQCKTSKRVILVVTHELRLARQIADHVLFLDHGKVCDDCSADGFFHEKNMQQLSSRAQKFLENFS